MTIRIWSKNYKILDCEHCLKNIRSKLTTFFNYIDCTNSGAITSEKLYNGVKFI